MAASAKPAKAAKPGGARAFVARLKEHQSDVAGLMPEAGPTLL
jgi:hypothetical protein